MLCAHVFNLIKLLTTSVLIKNCLTGRKLCLNVQADWQHTLCIPSVKNQWCATIYNIQNKYSPWWTVKEKQPWIQPTISSACTEFCKHPHLCFRSWDKDRWPHLQCDVPEVPFFNDILHWHPGYVMHPIKTAAILQNSGKPCLMQVMPQRCRALRYLERRLPQSSQTRCICASVSVLPRIPGSRLAIWTKGPKKITLKIQPRSMKETTWWI